jgi:hypothetical protein
MHLIALIRRAAAVALLVVSAPAFAQSAADFQVLEKQIQDLQAKVKHLEKEQADSIVNYSGTAANAAAAAAMLDNRFKLDAGVTQLKLFGDLRLRYQYDQFHPEVNNPELVTDDRSRFRFRLRIGADILLGDQFFGNVTLSTNQASDSTSVTYNEGYDNYSIYIDKAFLGWTPNDWFTIIAGKQSNPFYTTDLVWSPEITPAGLVEIFDLSKAFLPDNSRFSLRLVSMQGVFENGSNFNVGSDTAMQFVEQLQARYAVSKDISVSFAPGFMIYTAASLSGLQNAQPFTKSSDVLTAANGIQTQTTTTDTQTETIKYDATGKPSITLTPVNTTTAVTTTDPSTGATRTVTTQTTNEQVQKTIPFGAKGNNLKIDTARANKAYVTTKTVGGGTTTVTSPVGPSPATESGDLAIITAPGDVTFKIGSLPTKLYWDFAYNTEGAARATNEYLLSNHKAQDDFAWLAGIQFGENAHAGNWSLNLNYRQVGLDSIDPNINDNYFALSYLNVQGPKISVAYNFTDYLVGAVAFYRSWDLRHGIVGGEATGGAQLANAKSVDVLQVDMNLKF